MQLFSTFLKSKTLNVKIRQVSCLLFWMTPPESVWVISNTYTEQGGLSMMWFRQVLIFWNFQTGQARIWNFQIYYIYTSQPGNFKISTMLPGQQASKNHIIDGLLCSSFCKFRPPHTLFILCIIDALLEWPQLWSTVYCRLQKEKLCPKICFSRSILLISDCPNWFSIKNTEWIKHFSSVTIIDDFKFWNTFSKNVPYSWWLIHKPTGGQYKSILLLAQIFGY